MLIITIKVTCVHKKQYDIILITTLCLVTCHLKQIKANGIALLYCILGYFCTPAVLGRKQKVSNAKVKDALCESYADVACLKCTSLHNQVTQVQLAVCFVLVFFSFLFSLSVMFIYYLSHSYSIYSMGQIIQ